jgi:hypothetical protein
LKVVGTSAKNGDGIDAVFDDMLTRMSHGKTQFFGENKRERGATISLNKNTIEGGDFKKKGDGKNKAANGGKKKKCC